MNENTETELPLSEEQLQAITGGSGLEGAFQQFLTGINSEHVTKSAELANAAEKAGNISEAEKHRKEAAAATMAVQNLEQKKIDMNITLPNKPNTWSTSHHGLSPKGK